jgi:hypothetical protein
VSGRPHLPIVRLAALAYGQMPAYPHRLGRFEPFTLAPLRPEIQTVDHAFSFVIMFPRGILRTARPKYFHKRKAGDIS